MINDYVGMTDMGDRQELLNSLAKADLLIIDEFGYLPHDKEAGSLFYQVISDRACPCEGRGMRRTEP